MASENGIQYVRGIAHWAKVLGQPRLNKFSEDKEWTIDLSIDREGLKLFKQLGITDRLRDPKDGEDRDRYITFKQKELRPDGTKNEPIKVVDINGQPWDGRLIGNGSEVDVKFVVKDYGKGKKAGVYIRAVRVLKLVEYHVEEFAPISSDDEYFAGVSQAAVAEPEGNLPGPTILEDLDDDIPE